MNNAASSTLFAHWDQLRAGRPAPDRTEIDPRAIAPILGDTIVLETDRNGSLIYRLAGSRACTLFAGELKGTGFLDVFTPDARKAVTGTLGDALAAPAGMLMQLSATSTAGRSMALEAILLPLVHRGRLGARLIGAMSAAELPYWIGRDGLASIEIETIRLVWPTWQDPAALAATSPVQPTAMTFSARPALRIIQGGNVA